MKTEIISTKSLAGKPFGSLHKTIVLENEVQDVLIECISIKGNFHLEELTQSDVFDVLLTIYGEGILMVDNIKHEISSSTVARMPFKEQYSIQVEKDKEFCFLRLRKLLDKKDVQVIKNKIENFNTPYIKALADCPTYTEDIKSEKTINRMILPEGLVPRFCMGSVETKGPDEVAQHDHPMLDQLFFGLPGCQCNCHADGNTTSLTENLLLHIPLGSTHSVSVDKGEKLAYIWMDFFLTLEGEKYMGQQHQMGED